MSGSTNKLKLPEIEKIHSTNSIQQHPSISIIQPTDSSSDESRTSTKGHFHYIIKKVSTDDLFDDKMRQSNFMGLSQIKEENTGDLDELFPSQLAAHLGGAKSDTTRNIFTAEMITSTKYKEQSKGPLFFQGKVLKHTIIGPTDLFERQQRIHKKNIQSVAPFEQRDSLNDLSLAGKSSKAGVGSFVQDRPSTGNSDRLGSAGSSYSKRFTSLSEKKRNIKSDIKLTKEDLVSQINEAKERQTSFIQDEANKFNKKPLADRLFLTREQRNLAKFEENNEKWQTIVVNIDKKIARKAGESVMLAGEKHRAKKETADALDIIKSDEDKYGSKFWQRTLRKYEDKDKIGEPLIIQMSEEPDEAFTSKTDAERPVSTFEIIRKPLLTKTAAEITKSKEKLPGRTEKEYIDSKFQKRGYLLEGMKPPQIDQMGDLVIKGQNKLELEADAVMRHTKGKDSIRVNKDYFERKTMKELEETLERNKNYSEITKHGLSAFLKC